MDDPFQDDPGYIDCKRGDRFRVWFNGTEVTPSCTRASTLLGLVEIIDRNDVDLKTNRQTCKFCGHSFIPPAF